MDRLQNLQTEARNPASTRLDELTSVELVDLMCAEDAAVPAAVAACRQQIAQAIDAIAARLASGGRLVYVGAGTSGRLGVLDASECPPTFGTPPSLVTGIIAGGPTALVKSAEGAEDDVNAGAAAMDTAGLTNHDVVVGIAASGTTPYVRVALTRAQTLGARTILVTCGTPPKALSETCDVVINPVTGPEVLTGSTRLKAGTATKLVLNTLTTGAMIRLGKVYGNLMVDLKATNEKLTDRAARIIMTVTGVDRSHALDLLTQADGHVKAAIVMQARNVPLDQASKLITDHEGRLREIIAK